MERGTVASPTPSTKSRRWVEISDGLLFMTHQKGPGEDWAKPLILPVFRQC